MNAKNILFRLSAIPLLFSLNGGTPAAGVSPGDKAPLLEPKGLDNTELKTLDSLRGKLLLYEFFAYW